MIRTVEQYLESLDGGGLPLANLLNNLIQIAFYHKLANIHRQSY